MQRIAKTNKSNAQNSFKAYFAINQPLTVIKIEIALFFIDKTFHGGTRRLLVLCTYLFVRTIQVKTILSLEFIIHQFSRKLDDMKSFVEKQSYFFSLMIRRTFTELTYI